MAQLELLLTGIVVVLIVLVVLWGACAIIGVAFRERPSPDTETSAEEPQPQVGIPAHHIAVITGAVAEMMPGAFRVLNVHAPAMTKTAWVESTRFQQVHTHRVRWNWTVPVEPTTYASPNTAKTDNSQKDQDSTVVAKLST